MKMTSIMTDQILNPPVVSKNPGQTIKERPITQSIRTDGSVGVSQLRPFKHLNDNTTITWSSLANQLRLFRYIPWSIADATGSLATIELTVDNIIKWTVPLIPPASHFDFDAIRFVIHKNSNPMYQGKLLIVYDPSPHKDYYGEWVGSNDFTNSRSLISQFQFVEFDPTNTDSMEIIIENFLPFDFLRLHKTVSPSTDASTMSKAQFDYMQAYSLGRLRIFVFNQLRTTSTTNYIPVTIMAQLEGLKYAGRNFY